MPVQVVRTKTTPPAAEKCEDPRELQKLMSEMLICLQLEFGVWFGRAKTDGRGTTSRSPTVLYVL